MKMIVFDWGWTLWNPEKKKIMEDALEIVEYFKELKYIVAVVALASDGDIERRLEAMKQTGIYTFCDTVKISRNMNKDKLYEELLKEFKLDPEDVIVVDDKLERGIKWGVSIGVVTIWFQNNQQMDQVVESRVKPSFVIKSLKELKNIVRH